MVTVSKIKSKDLKLSGSEVEILREFVDREVENIKVFGPAEPRYGKSIESLKNKLS